MKITVLTSNQPRHLSLIADLADIAEEVFAVQECSTVFPGEVEDFYRRSDVMKKYFARVIDAEGRVFGRPRFHPGRVRSLALKMGDVSRLPLEALAPALAADVFVVFGASYIRGPLVDALIQKGAINIHMGTSPYYRAARAIFGRSTMADRNTWAPRCTGSPPGWIPGPCSSTRSPMRWMTIRSFTGCWRSAPPTGGSADGSPMARC